MVAKLAALTLFLFVLCANCEDDICDKCKCETEGILLKIDCTNRGITQMFASWPENDSISVSFDGNNIETLGQLPPSNASKFDVILSNCAIVHLSKKLFQHVVNVKYVDLSHNLITAEELIEDTFKNAYNESFYEPLGIEHLNLAYNNIHSLQSDIFEHMTNLKELNLEGNEFRHLDLHTQLAISSIKTLQRLNLANNDLTELVDDVISKLNNLYYLDISRNDIHFVPNSLANIGASLKTLILDGNPIMEFVDETFIGLGNIEELSANNLTELKYINANVFVPLPKLKKLKICNNLLLTDIDREAFRPNNNLREFYLNNNNLYKLDYKLLNWTSLQVFQFNENPFECSCDLYNITTNLSLEIKRAEDGPYCFNINTNRAQQVFCLNSDVCSIKKHRYFDDSSLRSYHHVSFILTTLTIVLIFAAALVMHLGFNRLYRANRNVFESNISYGRIHQGPP